MGPPRLGNPYDTMEDSMAVASAGTVPPNKSVDYSDTYEEIGMRAFGMFKVK